MSKQKLLNKIRPEKTLNKEEYFKSYDVLINNKIKEPCIECSGLGKIYNPREEPDIIEGYKLIGKISCPLCKGQGTTENMKHIREAIYNEYREKQYTKYKRLLEEKSNLEKALEKLTEEDLEIILEIYNKI